MSVFFFFQTKRPANCMSINDPAPNKRVKLAIQYLPDHSNSSKPSATGAYPGLLLGLAAPPSRPSLLTRMSEGRFNRGERNDSVLPFRSDHLQRSYVSMYSRHTWLPEELTTA